MSLTKKATKGHLIVGLILITFSLAFLFLKLFSDLKYIEIGIHIFGVWGGVEVGRYLEFQINKQINNN